MRTLVATTSFMVRDDSGFPHHFAPTSGPISEETLVKLSPSLNIVEDFIGQGVLREFDPKKDAQPETALVGAEPDAMLYVRPSEHAQTRGKKR